MIEHEKLIKGAGKEMETAPEIRFNVDPRTAMMLMGALQLALRHPGFTNDTVSGKRVKAVAIEIGRQLSHIGPNVAEMVALGWVDQNSQPPPPKDL